VLRFAADALLCFGAAAALSLLAWRQSRIWCWISLSLFTLLAANIHHGAQDLLIDVGLLAWGLLCFTEDRKRLTVYSIALLVFGAFTGLTKFTCLVLAGTTVAAVAANAFMKGNLRAGAGLLGGFTALVLGGWTALDQNLSDLPAFVRSASVISSGYVQAMAWNPRGASCLRGFWRACSRRRRPSQPAYLPKGTANPGSSFGRSCSSSGFVSSCLSLGNMDSSGRIDITLFFSSGLHPS